MASLFLGILKALRLPIRLLKGWKKKRQKVSEKERKIRAYVYNFSERRTKNVSYQWSLGKDKQKKQKKGKF